MFGGGGIPGSTPQGGPTGYIGVGGGGHLAHGYGLFLTR